MINHAKFSWTFSNSDLQAFLHFCFNEAYTAIEDLNGFKLHDRIIAVKLTVGKSTPHHRPQNNRHGGYGGAGNAKRGGGG